MGPKMSFLQHNLSVLCDDNKFQKVFSTNENALSITDKHIQ